MGKVARRGKHRQVSTTRVTREPVFDYVSKCCEAPAKKPRCERTEDDKREGKFSQSHLGKWHCSLCSKNCKVSRTRRGTDGQVHV